MQSVEAAEVEGDCEGQIVFVNFKDYCYCTVFLKNVMRCGGGGGGSEVWWQVLGVYADKVV